MFRRFPMFALLIALVSTAESIAQSTPPSLAPTYTLSIPGFPGADGHDAVATCGSEILYVRFTDNRIQRLTHSSSSGWVETDFSPQGSASGFSWVRVYGNGNLLAALYETPYTDHRVDIFERDAAGVWTLGQSITAPGSGSFVHVNQLAWSGTDLLVVDRYADSFRGAAFVFSRMESGLWEQTAKLQGSGVHPFYTEVWSAALDGNQAILGHWLNNCGYSAVSGTAYVFEKGDDGVWTESAALRPPTARCGDAYAANVTIRDGDAFASSPGDNRVHRFRKSGAEWSQLPDLAIPTLDGNPSQGNRLQATAWGLISRTSDARLVAYAQFAEDYQPVAVLTPGALPSTDCYCWNIATVGSRVVTAYATSGGGATLAIFELGDVIDCNGDGLADFGQIQSGRLADADADGVPDICENTIVVPTQFPTIQSAIDAVPAGATKTISVLAGTYNESFSMNGKDVVIRGAAGGTTIIDGTGLQDAIALLKGGEPATAGLENLVFRNGEVGSRFTPKSGFTIGGAIYANNSNAFIRNCRFEGCRADFGGAIYQYRGTMSWENLTFVDNTANDEGGAALVYNVTGTATDCTFTGNRCGMFGPGSGSAFKAVGANQTGESVTLERCTITDNIAYDFGAAVEFYEHVKYLPGVLRLMDCEIANNVSGDPVASGPGGLRVLGGQSSCVIGGGTTICGNDSRNVLGPYLIDGSATVCDCEADISGNGQVDAADLGILLSVWGTAPADGDGDLNHDGIVGAPDLSSLLSRWGPCTN